MTDIVCQDKLKIPAYPQGSGQRGIFSFTKENSPLLIPQEKGFSIANEQLEELQCLPMLLPARGVAAFRTAIRFASASTTRCRSAHLVEVRSNFRLSPVSTMRRAKQCRYFARSPPPSKHHSRLTIVRRGCKTVTIRRDSWRSHVHRTYIAQRVQLFEIETANVKRLSFGRATPVFFLGKENGGRITRHMCRIPLRTCAKKHPRPHGRKK